MELSNPTKKRFKTPCKRCGLAANYQWGGLTIHMDDKGKVTPFSRDHVVPKSKLKKGTDHSNNIQVLCYPCNRLKGDKSEGQAILEFLKLRLSLAKKTVEVLKNG